MPGRNPSPEAQKKDLFPGFLPGWASWLISESPSLVFGPGLAKLIILVLNAHSYKKCEDSYKNIKLSTTVLSIQVLQSDNILANEHELEPNVALKYCWSFLYCYLCNHERTKINKLTIKKTKLKTTHLLYLQKNDKMIKSKIYIF